MKIYFKFWVNFFLFLENIVGKFAQIGQIDDTLKEVGVL